MRPTSLLLLLIFLLSCSENKDKKESPNFILFLVDDQGWSGTSVNMSDNIDSSGSLYFETPNLERLASSGMRFSRGYSSSPVCSPSMILSCLLPRSDIIFFCQIGRAHV